LQIAYVDVDLKKCQPLHLSRSMVSIAFQVIALNSVAYCLVFLSKGTEENDVKSGFPEQGIIGKLGQSENTLTLSQTKFFCELCKYIAV
jgi:hypothetical protein